MSELIKQEQWVWVVVQNPDGDEHFLGQHDNISSETYIPTFLEKNNALQCLNLLAIDKGTKYEIQAIQFEDLSKSAAENGYQLFV